MKLVVNLTAYFLLSLASFAQARLASKARFLQDDFEPLQHNNIEDQHRRAQQGGCGPIYPNPNTIAFNLTEDFMIKKVNVTRTLSSVVSREHSGQDIEDLIEEQRQIYELFDGFSDCNDQALIAKTKDTKTCFVTFQSVVNTGTLENLVPYLLGKEAKKCREAKRSISKQISLLIHSYPFASITLYLLFGPQIRYVGFSNFLAWVSSPVKFFAADKLQRTTNRYRFKICFHFPVM